MVKQRSNRTKRRTKRRTKQLQGGSVATVGITIVGALLIIAAINHVIKNRTEQISKKPAAIFEEIEPMIPNLADKVIANAKRGLIPNILDRDRNRIEDQIKDIARIMDKNQGDAIDTLRGVCKLNKACFHEELEKYIQEKNYFCQQGENQLKCAENQFILEGKSKLDSEKGKFPKNVVPYRPQFTKYDSRSLDLDDSEVIEALRAAGEAAQTRRGSQRKKKKRKKKKKGKKSKSRGKTHKRKVKSKDK